MKKILLSLSLAILSTTAVFSQMIITALPNNGNVSGNARAPQGSQRYIRTAYILTAGELITAGVPSGQQVTSIGFVISSLQNIATKAGFKVYLQNTSDANYSKPSINWTNGTNGVIDGMTLVHNDSITIPATTGAYDVPFTGGTPFTYTGGALYVAYEYNNPAGALAGGAGNVSLCNNSLANSLRNAFSTTAMPTDVGTPTAFRPETRLGNPLTDILNVRNIFTKGKHPIPHGNADSITALISNVSNAPASYTAVFTVKNGSTVKYTGNTPVTNQPANSTYYVWHPGWSPTLTGTDTVIVSVVPQAGETYLQNSLRATVQNVNTDTFSYADESPATNAYGFGANNAGFKLVRYEVKNANRAITDVRVHIYNINSNIGNSVYAVVMNTAGTIIGQSAPLTIAAGDLGKYHTFPIQVPPVISNSAFYVGLFCPANATAYFAVSTQTEPFPSRAWAFYTLTSPTPAIPLNVNNQDRYMIQAIATSSVNIEEAYTNTFEAYPNPASDQLTMVFNNNTAGTLDVKLISLNGQTVYNENISQFGGRYTRTLDISGFAKGMYFLQVTTDEKTTTQKVVIE